MCPKGIQLFTFFEWFIKVLEGFINMSPFILLEAI